MCLRKPPRQHTHRQVRKNQLPTSLVMPSWFFVLLNAPQSTLHNKFVRLSSTTLTNPSSRWLNMPLVCRIQLNIVSGKWEHIANQIWDHLFADSNRELIIRVQNTQICRENNSNSPKIDVAVTGSERESLVLYNWLNHTFKWLWRKSSRGDSLVGWTLSFGSEEQEIRGTRRLAPNATAEQQRSAQFWSGGSEWSSMLASKIEFVKSVGINSLPILYLTSDYIIFDFRFPLMSRKSANDH